MLERPYVFERPNGSVAVMLRSDSAQPMLEKMKNAGWSGSIDWWTTELRYRGEKPVLPLVIGEFEIAVICGGEIIPLLKFFDSGILVSSFRLF